MPEIRGQNVRLQYREQGATDWTDVALVVVPAPARPSLLQRLRARLAAAIAWLFAPPACEHCGGELRVCDVWYPPSALLEPMPVYLWHCPACEPLDARDPA